MTQFASKSTFRIRSRFLQSSISNRLTALVLIVTIPLLIGVMAYISNRAGNVIKTQALHNLQQNNQSLATNVSTWLELHVRTIQEVAMLPDIRSMDAARQKPALLAIADTHPNLFLVQTTDLNGINIARNDDADLNDYHDRAWFLGAKGGAPITFEALISRTIGKPALNMSTPIYDVSGKIVGVASIVSELSEISKEVLRTETGQGITFIVDGTNRVVAHPDPAYTEEELRNLSAYPPVAALSEGKTGQLTFTDENGVVWIAYVDRLDNGWGIVAQQTEAELLAPVRQFQTVSIIFIVIDSMVMFVLAWFAIRRSLQPIGALTKTVSAIAAGDLNRQADVSSQDEIGVLAKTFNDMTSQLRETLQGLEQRVAARTKDLATVAEISATTAAIREPFPMLATMVHLNQRRFNLYHSHVFTYHKESDDLQIVACGYREGDVHEGTHGTAVIPLSQEQSLVARAARTRKPVIVNDVRSDPGWLPNPLLPETRAEMAVPMIVGDELLGVLDVQADHVDAFTEEDANIQLTLASQIATSYQSAVAYEQAKEQANFEALVNTIGQKIQRAASVEETLQTAVRELGSLLGAPRAKAILNLTPQGDAKLVSDNETSAHEGAVL